MLEARFVLNRTDRAMTKKSRIKPKVQHYNSASKWNALIEAQVVGQGQSAQDAQMHAQHERPTERAQLVYFESGALQPLPLPAIVADIAAAWPTKSDVWIDGETIARTLRKQKLTVFGLITSIDLDSLFDHLDGQLAVTKVGASTPDLLQLTIEDNYIVYTFNIRKQQGADIKAHLLSQLMSFEGMAMALHEPHQFLDVANGAQDVRGKVLRLLDTSDTESGAVIGPLRMAMALGMQFHAETKAYVKSQMANTAVPADYTQLLLMLGDTKPSIVLRSLAVLGGLETKFPDLARLEADGAWKSTLQTLDSLTGVLSVLHRTHDVDAASEFALGLISARIGRFRIRLSDVLETVTASGVTVRHLLFLAALLCQAKDAKALVAQLNLTEDELQFVRRLIGNRLKLTEVSVFDWTPEVGEELLEQMGDSAPVLPLLTLALKHGEWTPAIPHEDWANLITVCVAYLEQYYAK